MKTTLILILGFMLLTFGGLAAQDKTPTMSLTRVQGWIVDAKKGAEHANEESKDIVLQNHEKGSPLIFVTASGKIYHLDDQDQAKAAERVGTETVIIGSIDSDSVMIIRFSHG